MNPEPFNLFIALAFNWQIGLEIITLILLLVLSALISGAEIAFFSLSKHQLDEAKENKTDNIEIIDKQLNKPKKLLATILITNNFINILFILIFTYVSSYFLDNIESKTLKFILEVVLVTFLLLLFGEVLPKVYANRNAMKFAIFMAKPIKLLNSFFSFLSVPLMSMTSIIENRLQKKQTDLSVETLSEALKLTTNDTSDEEQKMLEGIVSFGNTETVQVMCPRIDVFALSDEESFESILKKITKNGHSRIPVYHETIDNIKGILYTKDILTHLDKKKYKWQELLREAFFVPENKKLDDLLKEIKLKKIHLAIVVDEYGGTSGIVTLEDVIEEIVGDINYELDENDFAYSKIDSNNYIFDAKISIKDFCKILELNEDDFENKKGESETIAGFILEIYEQFPKKGDVIKFKNITFTIETFNKKRIKQIKVTLN